MTVGKILSRGSNNMFLDALNWIVVLVFIYIIFKNYSSDMWDELLVNCFLQIKKTSKKKQVCAIYFWKESNGGEVARNKDWRNYMYVRVEGAGIYISSPIHYGGMAPVYISNEDIVEKKDSKRFFMPRTVVRLRCGYCIEFPAKLFKIK